MESPGMLQPSAPVMQRDLPRAAHPTEHHPTPPTIAGTQPPYGQNWLPASVPPQANVHLGAPTKPPGAALDGFHSVAIDRGKASGDTPPHQEHPRGPESGPLARGLGH